MNSSVTVQKSLFDKAVKSEVWASLTKINDFLAERNIEAYVVGGLIRDALLERNVADIDLAVKADALEVASEVADALGGKFVPLDKINGLGRVVLSDKKETSMKVQTEHDFSSFTGSIEEDLARRDFTIDALAVELDRFVKDSAEVQILDPFNGWEDLRQKVIRAVADEAFESDAVRLLRAVRLAAELGFDIDENTESLIRRYSPLIANVAGERIREELLKLLATSNTGQILDYLDQLGLLMAIFPELAETKGFEQAREHCWNVLDHSLQTVNTVDFLLRQGDWQYVDKEVLDTVPWSARLARHFEQKVSKGSTRRLLLKLAALLHDISKPRTKVIVNGRIRFLGHAREGAPIAVKILERLRFSAREVKLVSAEVEYHLRPVQMGHDELPTNRAIYRYFRDTGDDGIDILFLSLADHLATRGPNLDSANWQEHCRLVDYVIGKHFEKEGITRPPKLVDGDDLIRTFSVNPGPQIGELLEAVREAQASGEVTTKEEALAYVEKSLTSNHG